MNIKQAKEEIKNTVKAYHAKDEYGDYVIPAIRQRPILLIGAPGIGKTQIMEQIAMECKIGLVAYTITHHTRQSAVGLPMISEEEFDGKKYSVTEYTMSEIIASVHRKIKSTGLKEGILFIDEINCVSETLAPTMLQFLQCKTFGNQSVPEGWIIVAAGNPPEYNKSVRDFDMVTLDRVRYMQVEADYNVWKEYARSKKINGAILSYLDIKPNNFYRVEADVDGMMFVTARGWEDLSNLMDTYEKLDIPVDESTVKQFIHHKDIAEDAAAYFELYRKYQDDYATAAILEGKAPAAVYARLFDAAFDERLSVVNLLLSGLTVMLNDYKNQKLRVDYWYEFLKDYHSQVESAEDKKAIYDKLVKMRSDALELEVREEILKGKDEHMRLALLENIKKAGNDISAKCESKEAFDKARSAFELEREGLEQKEQRVDNALNNTFKFMEDAFGTGQEMIVFVTELTITSDAAIFLAEHTVPKYEEYKKELLIGTKKAQLLEELKH